MVRNPSPRDTSRGLRSEIAAFERLLALVPTASSADGLTADHIVRECIDSRRRLLAALENLQLTTGRMRSDRTPARRA